MARRCAYLFAACWLTVSAAAQPVEVSLKASSLPANPHDVSVRVTFEGSDPSGGPTPIAGFWDGDSTYRVRFAP
ncbi:MAG: DUF5060 domain-containing protein, partial [Bacteroidota bacterium]